MSKTTRVCQESTRYFGVKNDNTKTYIKYNQYDQSIYISKNYDSNTIAF